MPIILHINTAFETALVSLGRDEEIIINAKSDSQKDHASFLEPAIKNICHSAQITLNELDAVAVVNGPGSYTGLRVGLASAKALCYVLQKPLILLNTLDVMACALKLQSIAIDKHNTLFCPMIDARRMEVYTALYNEDLEIIKPYSSEILDQNFLEKERNINNIIAGGNGVSKLQKILADDSMTYIDDLSLLNPTAIISNKLFIKHQFSQVAYSEPFYLKPVYLRK